MTVHEHTTQMYATWHCAHCTGYSTAPACTSFWQTHYSSESMPLVTLNTTNISVEKLITRGGCKNLQRMWKNVRPWQFSLWHQYRLQWCNFYDERQVSTRWSEMSGLPILQQSAILWQVTDITSTGKGLCNPLPPPKIKSHGSMIQSKQHPAQPNQLCTIVHDFWPPLAVATIWTASIFSATVDLYFEHLCPSDRSNGIKAEWRC